jgi:hypothetical protein
LDEELAALTVESYEELLADWVVYLMGIGPEFDDEMSPMPRAALESFATERSRHLMAAQELLADTRPAAVAAIRARVVSDSMWAGRNMDLDALLDGYEALLGQSRACRAAEVRVRIRAQALRAQVDNHAVVLESDLESGYDIDGRRLSPARRTELREALAAVRAFLAWLDGMRVEHWESLPRDARVNLSSGTLPPPPALAVDWARVGSELERLARACSSG